MIYSNSLFVENFNRIVTYYNFRFFIGIFVERHNLKDVARVLVMIFLDFPAKTSKF